MKKTSLQTALNIQLSKSCNNVLHGFYLRFINKPRMLNDILPLGDPKSSSGVRQNVKFGLEVSLFLVPATNSVSYYEKFHLHIITHKIILFTGYALSHPSLLSWTDTYSVLVWAVLEMWQREHGVWCVPTRHTPRVPVCWMRLMHRPSHRGPQVRPDQLRTKEAPCSFWAIGHLTLLQVTLRFQVQRGNIRGSVMIRHKTVNLVASASSSRTKLVSRTYWDDENVL